MNADILVVDDEEDIRNLIAGILSDEGHQTRTAFDSDSALAAISERRPSMIFLDIWMQGSKLDGLELLEIICQQHPNLPVIIISGHGNIETAVSAIKIGAYDYIEKPFKVDRLILISQRALEASKLRKQVKDLQRLIPDMPELIGNSLAVQQLRAKIEKVSLGNSRILISGDEGSGKEAVARAIHKSSNRKNNPFVVFNAATILAKEIPKTLFGIEGRSKKNTAAKIGMLEEAHTGTLFLDEVNKLSLEDQQRILHVLSQESFERIGGTKKVSVDVRIISSTSVDLESLIEKKLFRQDLFHRLCLANVEVPPLTHRREDIPELINAFMQQIQAQSGLRILPIANDAMHLLQSHSWPGNLRQLRNNVERIMLLAKQKQGVVGIEQLPKELDITTAQGPKGEGKNVELDITTRLLTMPLRKARETFERDYLLAQLKRFDGNIAQTADFVGMERSAFYKKMKQLNVG